MDVGTRRLCGIQGAPPSSKIGSPSYKAFLIELTEEVERTRMANEVAPNLFVRRGQSVLDIMSDVASITKKAVDACTATVSPLALMNAARTIASSTRVVMYAAGDSAVSCEMFMRNLQDMGIVAIGVYHYGHAWATTRMHAEVTVRSW